MTLVNKNLSVATRLKLEAFRRMLLAERALAKANKDLNALAIPPGNALEEYYRLTEEMRAKYEPK